MHCLVWRIICIAENGIRRAVGEENPPLRGIQTVKEADGRIRYYQAERRRYLKPVPRLGKGTGAIT